MAIFGKAGLEELGRLLKGAVARERLEELPEESGTSAKPETRSVAAMLFELEPLPEAPTQPDPHLGQSVLGRYFSIEDLPEDPEPPPTHDRARSGLFHSLFGIDDLAVEPLEQKKTATMPLLRWLLWPESIDDTPREK